jgi:cobalt-zinc-cadmium efflux system membrane fusion protein
LIDNCMKAFAIINNLQWRICTLGLAGGLIAALSISSCTKAARKAEETSPKIDGDKITLPANSPQKSSLTVEVAKPIEKSVTRLNGRLVWNEDATVRVFAPVAGRVERIEAKLGDWVNVGDPLATLSSPDLGQAQADASRAAAGLKLAERTHSRLTGLFTHGAAAQKDVEAAEDDLETKRSENERAQGRLRLYGGSLGAVNGLFPLKSPLAGVIVDKSINPGQEIRPDQMLAGDARIVQPQFVISNPSRLAVLLDVTELELGSLKAGQRFEVRTRAYPDKIFEGRIQIIGQSLDPQTRTVKARGLVENPDGLLRAEMYVSVDVADGEETPGALAPANLSIRERPLPSRTSARVEIPVSAVFSKENQRYVFVEKSPGEYQRQTIEAGGEHDGKIRVTSGIEPGQRIVTEGSLLLQAMTEGAKE